MYVSGLNKTRIQPAYIGNEVDYIRFKCMRELLIGAFSI